MRRYANWLVLPVLLLAAACACGLVVVVASWPGLPAAALLPLGGLACLGLLMRRNA